MPTETPQARTPASDEKWALRDFLGELDLSEDPVITSILEQETKIKQGGKGDKEWNTEANGEAENWFDQASPQSYYSEINGWDQLPRKKQIAVAVYLDIYQTCFPSLMIQEKIKNNPKPNPNPKNNPKPNFKSISVTATGLKGVVKPQTKEESADGMCRAKLGDIYHRLAHLAGQVVLSYKRFGITSLEENKYQYIGLALFILFLKSRVGETQANPQKTDRNGPEEVKKTWNKENDRVLHALYAFSQALTPEREDYMSKPYMQNIVEMLRKIHSLLDFVSWLMAISEKTYKEELDEIKKVLLRRLYLKNNFPELEKKGETNEFPLLEFIQMTTPVLSMMKSPPFSAKLEKKLVETPQTDDDGGGSSESVTASTSIRDKIALFQKYERAPTGPYRGSKKCKRSTSFRGSKRCKLSRRFRGSKRCKRSRSFRGSARRGKQKR